MTGITHGYERICLVTAVDFEFKTVAGLLAERALFEHAGIAGCRGQWQGRPLVVLRSEMGAVGFGAKLLRYLAAESCDAVIVVGLAGGLAPELRMGDAVIYDRCLDARGRETSSPREEIASIAADAALAKSLSRALAMCTSPHRVGMGVTARRIATTRAEKAVLAAVYSGALAVDLESYEVLQACAEVGVPAAVLRVISDAAGDDIPDFNRAYDAEGRTRLAALAAAMATRPMAAGRMMMNIRRVQATLRLAAQAALDASLHCDGTRLTGQKPLP